MRSHLQKRSSIPEDTDHCLGNLGVKPNPLRNRRKLAVSTPDMMMETTLYSDEAHGQGGDGVKALKRSMTLDFAGALQKPKRQKLGGPAVLASPDLNMLKLASPELERMIIAQNGMITTTPTPTQFICPKFVTDEQEAYARGFVDALEELHKKETVSDNSQDGSTVGDDVVTLQPVSTSDVIGNSSQTLTLLTSSPAVQNITSYSQAYTTTSVGQTTLPQVLPQVYSTSTTVNPLNAAQNAITANPMLPRVKEEPQTVPNLCSSPPLSPINMERQETIKIERKRARNRIAARKCRHRKLERISRLESKVQALKDVNSDLSQTATQLRDQVCRLKEQIMGHVKNGCQVMMSQNLAF